MRDVLVIGAGPAGCVAASHLANCNYNVTIVEKTVFPRFQIGESLLPISMEHFEETGLLAALKKCDFEKKYGATFIRGSDRININFEERFTPGWTWTWQVPRDTFDHVLAQETARKGVEILYDAQLEAITIREDHIEVEINHKGVSSSTQFRYAIDTSGSAGVLTRLLDLDTQRISTNRSALFTHVQDVRAGDYNNPRQISFDVLAQDLWFWVIPFSNGNTSLGFVGDHRWFDKEKPSQEVFATLLEKSSYFGSRYRNLPFLFMPRLFEDYTCKSECLFGSRFALAGNTTGFVDPLFSSGVAVATGTGLRAAELINRQLKGEHVNWKEEYTDYIDQARVVFQRFVSSWYDGSLQTLFFHDEIPQSIKTQLTSVLAGYVWDQDNPFISKKRDIIKTLVKMIEIKEKRKL